MPPSRKPKRPSKRNSTKSPKPQRPQASTPTASASPAEAYDYPTADVAARPEIGTQAHFRQLREPTRYQYDASLAPEFEWDGQNPAREAGEALIRAIQDAATLEEAQTAAARLKAMSRPFLNWAGKAERLSFDVPTMPLFVHERLSTQAILESVRGHKRDQQESLLDELFGAPERPLNEQVDAYNYRDDWVNRMILGDSLVVMNSLLEYEQLGGQVQMIYIDPPYGVKFGSNFQAFVRKRDVKHNEDEDLTREPETVQAYRDTWELGLHSYLTYMRDRLFVARELLTATGSVFVQISDENLHHVREVMDEVFGTENFVAVIPFVTTASQTTEGLGSVADYLLWFAKDRAAVRLRKLYVPKVPSASGGWAFNYLEEADGTRRPLSREERVGETPIPEGARLYRLDNLTSQGATPTGTVEYEFEGALYHPGLKNHWKTSVRGLDRLAAMRRIQASTNQIHFVRFFDDFPVQQLTNLWTDTTQAGFVDEKLYAVQTVTKVIERCILMTTDPGDLVVDPTCGSGTTAYVSERWGRRWITIDTSRVPLALARQRILTATYDYYELKNSALGPAGGFNYLAANKTKNLKQVGPGIVPHITLGSIANNEPAEEEVLVDRPEIVKGVTRVAGRFVVEATIAVAEGLDAEPQTPGIQSETHQSHVERMIEVLRRAPVLRLPGNQTITLRQIRSPAKSITLSAEALVDAPTLGNLADDASIQRGLLRDADPVAVLFGPENGPISERFVREGWDEAGLKRYTALYVIGFGIDPKAREFVEKAGRIGIPCVYLQATMDLQMGDLLKNMRSSQVFSICGLPDVDVRRVKSATRGVSDRWEVELCALDSFDPATMEPAHLKGADVPAWLLDTDYNGLVFRVHQAFFPRTGAWENLKRALKVDYEPTVWEHLAGTVSTPFEAGERRQIAVKVIDPRGNELMVVKPLSSR